MITDHIYIAHPYPCNRKILLPGRKPDGGALGPRTPGSNETRCARANSLLIITRPAGDDLRRHCMPALRRRRLGEAVARPCARLAEPQHGETVGQGGSGQRRLTSPDAPAQPLLHSIVRDDEAAVVSVAGRGGEVVVVGANLAAREDAMGGRERKRLVGRRGPAAGAELAHGGLGHAGAVLPCEWHGGGGGVKWGEEAVVERRGRPREGEQGGSGGRSRG